MLKKLTLVFISVLLIVGCMAVPAMAEDAVTYTFNRHNYIAAESSMGSYGDMYSEGQNSALNYVTLDISSVPKGNYEVVFNGRAVSATTDSPLFVSLEASGNDIIYNYIPWTGTDINTAPAASVSLGVISVDSNSPKMKYKLIKGGNTMGWTFTLNRVGDYDKAGSYRFIKALRQDADATFLEKSTTDNYGVYPNNWMSWNADVEYSGIYDVYFYGGVQTEEASKPDMTFALSIDGTDVLTASAPWTGSSGTDYLGKTGSNKGWGAHKYTKVGSVALSKGVQTIKFTNKSSAFVHTSQMSDSYSRLVFVRTGDIIPLDAPEITTALDNENLSNSKVIIDFDKDIDSTASNLALITTTGGYGTASVAVDPTDASKVIVTGVAGRFTVNASAGFKATDGTMLTDDCSSDCYIPSCKVTNTDNLYPYGSNIYGRFVLDRTMGGSPEVYVYFVLYDANDNIVASTGGLKTVSSNSYNIQLSLPNTYTYEKAKLFLWEKDLTPIIINKENGVIK